MAKKGDFKQAADLRSHETLFLGEARMLQKIKGLSCGKNLPKPGNWCSAFLQQAARNNISAPYCSCKLM
ncbi:MAG: hypothetical protein LAN71_00550 [Acidobacteriia bacterium]|nr:hypothetical protein [Terriglobia bacterium]